MSEDDNRTTTKKIINFNKTVRERANRDPEFRNELLKEALEAIDCGDTYVAKALIQDYINTGTT